MRTKWECTFKIVMDHIRVHSLKRKGPRGSAFVSDRDLMGVHSRFVIQTTWECTRYAKLISECTPRWSLLKISSAIGPYQKRMHSDVVPFLFWSALQCGQSGILECTPMWSLSLLEVHSHVVLSNVWSALLYGPHPSKRSKYRAYLISWSGKPRWCWSL